MLLKATRQRRISPPPRLLYPKINNTELNKYRNINAISIKSPLWYNSNMHTYLTIITIIFFVIGLGAGLFRAVFFCLMIRNRKPDVKLYNPRFFIGLVTSKKLLTEKGIYWRNKSFKYLVVFLITFLSLVPLIILLRSR